MSKVRLYELSIGSVSPTVDGEQRIPSFGEADRCIGTDAKQCTAVDRGCRAKHILAMLKKNILQFKSHLFKIFSTLYVRQPFLT